LRQTDRCKPGAYYRQFKQQMLLQYCEQLWKRSETVKFNLFHAQRVDLDQYARFLVGCPFEWLLHCV
jgi:hypothetical protein